MFVTCCFHTTYQQHSQHRIEVAKVRKTFPGDRVITQSHPHTSYSTETLPQCIRLLCLIHNAETNHFEMVPEPMINIWGCMFIMATRCVIQYVVAIALYIISSHEVNHSRQAAPPFLCNDNHCINVLSDLAFWKVPFWNDVAITQAWSNKDHQQPCMFPPETRPTTAINHLYWLPAN